MSTDERMSEGVFWQQRVIALFSTRADLSQPLLLPPRQVLEPPEAQMLFRLFLLCGE